VPKKIGNRKATATPGDLDALPEIAVRARQARLRLGYTLADVANRVGHSATLVSHLEHGRFTPNDKYLRKFESVLGSLTDGEDEIGPSQTSLGAWLNRVRIQKDLSPAQLAERAGVSVAQVYNLESGRSTNPRPDTLQKLQNALGKQIPTEFVKEIEKESDLSQIAGVGRFVSFDPHDETQWPAEPGVYVIYDVTERPIYVGQAGEIRVRIRAHSEKKWFIRPFADSAAYVVIPDKTLRLGVERLLIAFMRRNALINSQGVDRD
jgi:transcriptional regulator with XRE-family HTH domain